MDTQKRIIKFRAWDKEQKLYRYLDVCDVMMVELDPIEGCLEFRGQYTGTKNKNGKEIYEGDILRGDWDLAMEIYQGTVEFYAGAFRIRETSLPINCVGRHKECEIIGNIYDNPELLEGNQEGE